MKKTLSAFLAAIILLASCVISISASPTEIPAEYDLRDYGWMSSVKSQGVYGTCWAHAICAVAESNMMKKGLASNDVDYSELQLAYFLLHPTDDPLGNYTNEGAYLSPLATGYGFDFLMVGADSGIAGYSLMTGIGLVDEADVPYSDAEQVRENGLDLSYAYEKTSARLSSIFWLSYSEPAKIKQAILDYGAVWTSLFDNSLDKVTPCYNPETGAYYKPSGTNGAQHAVTIAGWDDNYAISNFTEGNRPSNPGAWLIKDSAGTDWGVDGYWWASYEDVDFNTSSTKKVAVLDFVLPETYDRTYQYDGGSRHAQFGVSSNGKGRIYMANVFTSVKDERITAVSLGMSQYPNTPYTIYIYRNPSKTAGKFDPASGELIYEASGTTGAGGYYTVPVTGNVLLENGDTFSVIIGYEGADEDDMMWMDYDTRSTGEGSYFAHNSSHAEGQSFYCREINPSYNDWLDMTYWDNYLNAKYGNCNFRIKAHTSDIESEPQLTVTSSPSKLSYIEGNTLNLSGLSVSYTDENGITSPVSDYTVSIANGTVLSLSHNNAELTVSYGGLTVVAGTLSVSAKSAVSLSITSPPDKTSYVEGETFSKSGMVVEILYNNGDHAPVTQYTISPSGALSVSDTGITVSYSGLNVNQPITVTPKEPEPEPTPTFWQRVVAFFRGIIEAIKNIFR